MNERIKELLTPKLKEWGADNDDNFTEELDKFAELIVQDVRNVIADVYREYPLEQAGQFLYLDEEITEHFYGTPRKFE